MIAAMNEQARYGQLIRATMADRGMTQRDMSDITGWSQSVVSDILNGKRTLTPPEVVRTMAKVLEIPAKRQLEELGYIDPEELEPEVAYVIRQGDPRAKVLGRLEGAPPIRVEAIADLVSLFFRVSLPDESDIKSADRQDRDQTDSA